jgi:hypothetical protein
MAPEVVALAASGLLLDVGVQLMWFETPGSMTVRHSPLKVLSCVN